MSPRRSTLVVALITLLALALSPPLAGAAEPSQYGFSKFNVSLSTHQAGAHPDFTTSLELTQDPASAKNEAGFEEPNGVLRDLKAELPPGLIGNPNAVTQCSAAQFVSAINGGGCPQDSQVGTTTVRLYEIGRGEPATEPVFVLKPPNHNVVARLAFWAIIYPVYIDVTVRSEDDYGITASVRGSSSQAKLVSADLTTWGVPALESHDPLRVSAFQAFECLTENICSPGAKSGLSPVPFMSNPTSCGEALEVKVSSDSYQLPNQFAKASAPLGDISGCEALEFSPSFSAVPTEPKAASPTGMDIDLKIPQNENANSLATSEMRDTTVAFPKGMTVASGAADGLSACSPTQAHYKEPGAAECPEAAKIGSLEIDSPALNETLDGGLYQRTPEGGKLFRVWLIADGLGVNATIPAELEVDKQTGQITSLLVDNPQVPLEEVRLHVKTGPRAPLATPQSCGTYATAFTLAPWSGSAPISGSAPMSIDQGCDTGGFSPKLSAGTANPVAGAFSPLLVDLTRESGEQNVSGFELTLPPGVLAKLAGVGLCEGVAAQSGNCPSSSQVGTVAVAAGPGTAPLWVPQPGKDPTAIYLSGPYKDDPYSVVIKTPAQAGPFDLGTVVTRAGIYIDPETALATVKADPLPQFLEGVPISYRDIHADTSRVGFTLNPTNCDPMQARAKVTSILGTIANPTSRFQVGACERLPFKPKLSLRLHGKTNRGAHPALRATFLQGVAGEANVARASVALPRSEFLDQGHLGTICTRVQFAANNCPAASIYGHARAFTPLLAQPVEGPVYLRSSNHLLPDLVVAFRGQVNFNLAGRIDSLRGGIRTTFETIPDVPVKKFVLTMQGGKKGLLVNSRNLCLAPSHAIAKIDAQNGKTADQNPLVQNDCAKKTRKSSKHR